MQCFAFIPGSYFRLFFRLLSTFCRFCHVAMSWPLLNIGWNLACVCQIWWWSEVSIFEEFFLRIVYEWTKSIGPLEKELCYFSLPLFYYFCLILNLFCVTHASEGNYYKKNTCKWRQMNTGSRQYSGWWRKFVRINRRKLLPRYTCSLQTFTLLTLKSLYLNTCKVFLGF